MQQTRYLLVFLTKVGRGGGVLILVDDIKFGAGDKVGRGGVLILVDDIRFGAGDPKR